MTASLTVREDEPKAIVVIREELEKREADLLKVLPPGMDAQRFMRVALLAVSKSPDLLACTPGSIIRSIIEAAEIGLEPTGSLNRAWLIGFKEKDKARPEAQLMIGYQGYADLMRDSGKVRRISTEVVYEGDLFKVTKGSENPHIEHEPAYLTEDPTKITFVYGIAWFADGGTQQEVMSRAQVEVIRARSRQRNGPTWTQNWPQMARKTLIRRLANYVPLTARAVEVISRDDEREFGNAVTPPVTVSRTAQVRAQLAARNAPGAPEVVEVAADTPEGEGVAPDPAPAPDPSLCGAIPPSDALGMTLWCDQQPHTKGAHMSAEGSWPYTAS